ncbi:MAG: hypothetical protein R3A78_13355 [Polyangiales bacterium]|nr:hypothetical protein [Myxococcales bacterium]
MTAWACAAVACAFLAGCRSNPTPDSMRWTHEEMQTVPYGNFLFVEFRNRATAGGELIAIGDDSIWVRGVNAQTKEQNLFRIRIAEVLTARLARYTAHDEILYVWGFVGTLSSLTHGYFLVLSAPVWAGTTVGIAEIRNRAAIADYPDLPLEAFRPYARFPQGIPEGVSVAQILGLPEVQVQANPPPTP